MLKVVPGSSKLVTGLLVSVNLVAESRWKVGTERSHCCHIRFRHISRYLALNPINLAALKSWNVQLFNEGIPSILSAIHRGKSAKRIDLLSCGIDVSVNQQSSVWCKSLLIRSSVRVLMVR